MTTIGTFNADNDGYSGTVQTLTLKARLKLTAMERPSEDGPDYRIFSGRVELGAAWKKTARDSQREYLSVTIDDPSFSAPIYARLIPREDGFELIWNRMRLRA